MKILIVGFGSIGRKHVAAIHDILPDSTIFALRSLSSAKIEEGIINVFSLREIDNIDFAIISNPTALHKETIQILLDLNCPLFIEKPLFHNLEIINIVQCIMERGILNYIACNLRFLDSLKYLKSQLPGKRINEVNVYCGSYLPDWRPGSDFRNVYSSHSDQGGGVHLDLIHELDYVYWLFGNPNRVAKVLRNTSSLEIKSIDYANYCLEYVNFCASVILNYYRRDAKRSVEIVFDDETWDIDIVQNKITSGGRVIFESSQRIKDTYKNQMDYFIDLVRNKNSQSENTVYDALNVLRICLE